MKILQVGSSLYDWGGIERYVAYLTEGLLGRGHDVSVTCPPGSPLDKNAAGKKHLIALKGQFAPGSYLKYRRLFKENTFDVVHIHFSPDFVMPALAARHAGIKKIVMTRHVALHWSAGKVKRYTKLFDQIIPVSHAVETKLRESGVPQKMMTVAKAGVPALQANSAPKSEFTVGSFGRLVKEKGIDVLLKACNQGRLEIYGDGPERAELEKLATPNTKFMGFIPNVAEAMNACHVIAVPSVWEEAFPYSVLEAMSLGKPVVASRVGGLPEIVEDGVTGRLFEKGNVEELAAVLGELRADPQLCSRMGETAKLRHREEYTVERMAERIESVYMGTGTDSASF